MVLVAFTFQRKREGIAAEAALDGIYIIRTSVAAAQMDAPQCVRNYKSRAKVARHTLDDGTPAHSFATLLEELSTVVRNTCRTPKAGTDAPTFEVLTTPNAKQQRAFELIRQIRL